MIDVTQRYDPETKSAAEARVHFDQIAQEFDDLYEKDARNRFQRWLDSKLRASIYRRFELAFEAMGDLRGKTVLDVGCGGGRYSVTMAKLGARKVVGVDFAPSMIDMARELAAKEGLGRDRLSFVCKDATAVESDEPFDYALIMGVFDYIEDHEAFLASILSKVRTRVIASFPVKWSLWTPQRLIRYRLFKNCPLYFYSRPCLERLMEASGIRDYGIVDAYRDYVVVMDKQADSSV